MTMSRPSLCLEPEALRQLKRIFDELVTLNRAVALPPGAHEHVAGALIEAMRMGVRDRDSLHRLGNAALRLPDRLPA